MKVADIYYKNVIQILSTIREQEGENIKQAARLMVDRIKQDELIYVFGVGGHSFVGSEEFFYRAGGLANISPIYDLSLGLFAGGQKSTLLERTENYGNKVIQAQHLKEGDLLIITSLYGINSCTIDAALEAKKRGCKVIGFSSKPFSQNTPRDFSARPKSAENLYEIVDVHIDNHIPADEGLVRIEGYSQIVGSASTILQNFCINWTVSETVDLCVREGVEPPVWMSANIVGGDEKNRDMLEKYTPIIKLL